MPFPTTSEEHEIRNTLSCLQRKLEQITKAKNTILQKEMELLKAIECCKQTIAPWQKLNDECLFHIFVCLCDDHGPIVFPLWKHCGLPPQLVISHVCSRWRDVSLGARCIWANIEIHKNLTDREVFFGWLARAGSYPVSLAIDLEQFQSYMRGLFILSRFLRAVRIRTLNIKLVDSDQFELMQFPEFIPRYSSFEDIKLSLTFVFNRDDEQFDFHGHQFLKTTNSIAFRGRYPKIGKNIKTEYFPWAQLSCLDIQDCKDLTLQEAMGILRQTTIIEELYIGFEPQQVNIDGFKKVTLSCLRKLRLSLDIWPTCGYIANDEFLEAFECPNLVEFHLFIACDWSPETYNLLKRQYNLEDLEQLDMSSIALGCCLPMSRILRDAPMLQRLGLTKGITIDDDAISGIAIGTLGRCLSSIWFRSEDNHGLEREVIDMILSRQKNARRLISESRNWKEEISLFRKIYMNFWISRDGSDEASSMRALEEAGVKVEIIYSTASLKDRSFRPSCRDVLGFDDL